MAHMGAFRITTSIVIENTEIVTSKGTNGLTYDLNGVISISTLNFEVTLHIRTYHNQEIILFLFILFN